MGRLKTYADKLNHTKVVHKRTNSARCYNYIVGKGWSHYTKGFRKHTSDPQAMERGSMFLFSFLDRANPKTETVEEKGE